MKLIEACEPFFQHVCYLNRLAREGGPSDPGQCEAQLEAELARIRQDCKTSRELSSVYNDKVEWALIAFADFTIRESKFPFASRWRGLGPKRNNLVLDEQFFQLLDETLQETPSEANRQRLSVFYACLGLGFTGMYTGQPDELQRKLRPKMKELYARMGGTARQEEDYLCAEAYEHTDKRVLHRSSSRWFAVMVIVLIVMIPGVIVGNYLGYRAAQSQLNEALEQNKKAYASMLSDGKAP
jgi:type IV/VI secretion system ImpK/VasF family protein